MANMSYDKLAEEVAECRQRAEAVVHGLTAAQLTQRPDPAKWSIAECLTHLNLSAAAMQRFIAKAIENGRREKRLGSGPFKLGARGRLLIWIAEPPPKFRLRAPKAVAPASSMPQPEQVLAGFMKAQDEWQRLCQATEGLDMARINVGPVLSPFRCRLSASFSWMMAHQRRHLLQAENVKRQVLSGAGGGSRE